MSVSASAPVVAGPDVAATVDPALQRVIDYYEAAGPDYAAWSPAFNMHYGYYRRGMSPWRLAPMLAQMNDEVAARLRLPADRPARVLDLGCGLGEAARHIARAHPLVEVTGLTITPGQVPRAEALTAAAGLERRVRVVLADFTRAHLPDACADAAYAIESYCHALGPGRDACVRELRRLLRPGGRFVIADGFVKHGDPLPRWLAPIYRRVCDGWAIQRFAELPALLAGLRAHGFVDVTAEEVFWPLVPSALHVPATAARFLVRERLRGKIAPLRLGNALAPVYGLALGLARRHFGYFLVAGRLP